MAKFYIVNTRDERNNNTYYYIAFKDKDDDEICCTEAVAEEFSIPVDEYLNICKKNGSIGIKNLTNYNDLFCSVEQAQNAIQEILEFSIEFNKNNCCCNCEEDYSDITPTYPQDFVSDGEEISNEQINEIIEMCIYNLEQDDEADGVDITEGNTLILVNRSRMCDDPECEGHNDYYYKVTVCKGIYEYSGIDDYNLEDE